MTTVQSETASEVLEERLLDTRPLHSVSDGSANIESIAEYLRKSYGVRHEAATALQSQAAALAEARRDSGRLHDYANMRDWQVVALAKFAKWAISESAFAGCDLGGAEVQEKAQEIGLIVSTVYDPIKHGSSDVADAGMDWYEFTSLLSDNPETAEPFKPARADAAESKLKVAEEALRRIASSLDIESYPRPCLERTLGDIASEALATIGAKP